MYTLTDSHNLSFVGGTSLRLLRNINRFSEDLDFDNLGLTDHQIQRLVHETIDFFTKEHIEIELIEKANNEQTYFDIKFPRILFDLGITTNPREKLLIKFDYSNQWKDQLTETVLLRQYGNVESILTNSLNQLLVQKLTAYVERKTTQPRDIYDIIWLYSQGAEFDRLFAQYNTVSDVLERAVNKLAEEGVTRKYYTRLEPFLFNPRDVKKLDLFQDVLVSLQTAE